MRSNREKSQKLANEQTVEEKELKKQKLFSILALFSVSVCQLIFSFRCSKKTHKLKLLKHNVIDHKMDSLRAIFKDHLKVKEKLNTY